MSPGSRPPAAGRLSLAMIGTRGVPANYGGFETAIEEIGRRIADQGHRVVVYSRGTAEPAQHLGMERVRLPALRRKQLETPSHTGLSVLHTVTRRAPDAAFVFNAANSPFLPLLRARRIPTALHVDGLEWKRAKWGRGGQRFYRRAEEIGVRWADALIADAPGISDYYQHEFGVPTELIRYGAKLLADAPEGGVRDLGLEPAGFHLVVARFEPENHVLEIVEGFHRSRAALPLVVVGSAPYSARYTEEVNAVAAADPRIRLLGGVWDQDLLDALYFHALTYLHGHSVGGTNPSLLRAIGAGTGVIAFDVPFNTEIVGSRGAYFARSDDVAVAVEEAEASPGTMIAHGTSLRELAGQRFDWDSVAEDYLALARRLAAGESVHALARTARRRPDSSPGAAETGGR